MIVPQFWAERRLQHRERGKQFTVRRFGWSDASQEEAQANADARAEEALRRLLTGENLDRLEHKVAYNGADGLPIREEIVEKHGDTVVTRNSYGARCLNTPNVLFADIDLYSVPSGCLEFFVYADVLALAIAVGWWRSSILLGIGLMVAGLLVTYLLFNVFLPALQSLKKSPEDAARERVRQFVESHPDWHLRVYRTPAGFRVLAMHRIFDPLDPAVEEFFSALKVDPVYRLMCLNQKCFRARLTAKPWRIGIPDHMKPRPGVWPVAPERLPARQAWVERYEAVAASYAACAFMETLGSGATNSETRFVQDLHDRACRATSGLPIA